MAWRSANLRCWKKRSSEQFHKNKLQINLRFCENAHLPLPQAIILSVEEKKNIQYAEVHMYRLVYV